MAVVKDRIKSILKKYDKVNFTPIQISQINTRLNNEMKQPIIDFNKKEQLSIEASSKIVLNR